MQYAQNSFLYMVYPPAAMGKPNNATRFVLAYADSRNPSTIIFETPLSTAMKSELFRPCSGTESHGEISVERTGVCACIIVKGKTIGRGTIGPDSFHILRLGHDAGIAFRR